VIVSVTAVDVLLDPDRVMVGKASVATLRFVPLIRRGSRWMIRISPWCSAL